jgi:hypothetical protein
METWETVPVPSSLESLVPLRVLALLNLLLFVVLAAGIGWFFLKKKKSMREQPIGLVQPTGQEQPGRLEMGLETWSCGYIDPTSPRLQYTASSFGEILTKTYHWFIPSRSHEPSPVGAFAGKSWFATLPYDRILGGFLIPTIRHWGDRISVLLKLQQGRTSIYLLYIVVIFLVALCWGSWTLP